MEGIKETKEFVKFLIDLGMGFDRSLVDGKFNTEDMVHFMSVFMAAGPAFVGINKMPAELKDMDSEEVRELVEYIETEFDIANDQIEMIIEKSLKFAPMIYEFILLFKKN